MTAVPAEAVEAAAQGVAAAFGADHVTRNASLIHYALEAAAPLIAAAERERIIQLARHVHASYAVDPHQALSVLREFADLIAGDSP